MPTDHSTYNFPFTLEQLRLLIAISSEGSFKRAADSLYISQPAVSFQIRRLEKHLDIPMFDRRGRGAELTEAGSLLTTHANQILSLCQETYRALEDLHNLQGGGLFIGASPIAGTYLVPRLIGLFKKKYPNITVQSQVHSTRRTCHSVVKGHIDMGIIGGDVPLDLHSALEVIPYAADEIVLILPTHHPLAQTETIQRDDLYGLKYIALDAQSTIRKAVDQVLCHSNIDPHRLKIEMELNSIEAIKNAVEADLGAAFVSILAIEKDLEYGVVQRVNIDDVVIKQPLSLVVSPKHYRSKAAKIFIAEILPRIFEISEHLQPLASPLPTLDT